MWRHKIRSHFHAFLGRVTMRVSILTLFLSLTVIAFGASLSFLYYKDYKALSLFARKTIEESSGQILAKVQNLFTEMENLVRSNSYLIESLSEISSQNQWLHKYMLGVMQSHPDLPYLFIGAVNGNYVEVGNLAVSVQEHYLSDPSKLLPHDAMYEWQYYDHTTTPPTAGEEYYNARFQRISSEQLEQLEYDPRTRPWYQQAAATGKFSWSDVYRFFDTGDPGITAAIPLYSTQGQFIGVLGSALVFRFLSTFFAGQTVGKTGKPFLIDDQTGKIIIPDPSIVQQLPLTQDVVEAAYRTYQTSHLSDFDFKFKKIRYLAHIQPMQIQANLKWLIVIIVPFEDFFSALEQNQLETFFIVLFISFLSSLVVAYFAQKLSAPIVVLTDEITQIKNLELKKERRIASLIQEIFLIDSAVAAMRVAMRSFILYVPKEIVKQLLGQNKEIALGGEKKEVSIFFSDIADFTSIAETQNPEILMPQLSEYFDGVSKIILQTQGTIDKYMGDGVMAFWGAPIELPNHAFACAQATLLCNHFVKQLNERRIKEQKAPFYTRFGINVGTVIVGNIGTPDRLNYTLLGDAVNAAARLQSVNKLFHTQIIIS